MFVSITRTRSTQLLRGAYAKKLSFGRLSAASFSAFIAPNTNPVPASLAHPTSLQTFHQARYSSTHSFISAVDAAHVSVPELKKELSTLIDFKLDTDDPHNNAAFIEHLMDLYKTGHSLPKDFVKKLLNHSRVHQLTLPNILTVNRSFSIDDEGTFDSNLTIVGDVHGQYHDFAQIFQNSELAGYPSAKNQFIFNGDMVDRGSMAVEIVVVLLVAKLLCPESVHILRGNHETLSMTQAFGFQKEVLRKYDHGILSQFRDLFDALPVAAVVENKIFVTHGGIEPTVAKMSLEEINKINRVGEPDYENALIELLWSDPKDNLTGFRANKGRGGGTVCFGADVTEHFLANNHLSLLIRSHEVMMNGFETFHDGLCWSVFSAPNYCGDTGNYAALVRFIQPTSMQANVVQFFSAVSAKNKAHPA
eukprot:gene25190-28476_t